MQTNPRQTNDGQFYGNNGSNANNGSNNGYDDGNARQTPINYNDPNDHRNYENGLDLGLPPISSLANGMTYHDFDYVGYNTRD